MEVAHRVGLPMIGVNLPGHFMVCVSVLCVCVCLVGHKHRVLSKSFCTSCGSVLCQLCATEFSSSLTQSFILLQIRPYVADLEVLVDAFSGDIKFRDDAEEKLAGLFGSPVRLDPAVVRVSFDWKQRCFVCSVCLCVCKLFLSGNKLCHSGKLNLNARVPFCRAPRVCQRGECCSGNLTTSNSFMS